jgi:AcrR family transcriptional regulator
MRVPLSVGLKFMVAAKRSRSKSIQPSLLLAAANKVVVRQGVDALTLDAVAIEAGVSKGGLLHHFPNKEALIVGMVQQALDKFVEALNHELAKDPAPDTQGHWVRAYVRASALDDQENYELHFNLLAANFTKPELLKPMRDFWQECHTKIISSGLPPEVATVIRLAMDGLWLTHLHNFAPLQDPLRSQVIETVLKLAQP